MVLLNYTRRWFVAMATATYVTLASLSLTRALKMGYSTDLSPLQDWLDSHNIDAFSAKEITVLFNSKWKGPDRVCPPEHIFSNMRLTMHAAQLIRTLWGQRHKDGRIRCLSGFRPEAYNDILYAEERKDDPSAGMASQHIFFRALDLQPYNGKIVEFTALVEAVMTLMACYWPTGFGKYNTFVHIDIGGTGKYERRWDYRDVA